MKKQNRTKLAAGVGTNDANYRVEVSHRELQSDGTWKRVVDFRCPYYGIWHHMLARCYSPRLLEINPTYVDVKVCEEWVESFMTFRGWCVEMEEMLNFKVGDKRMQLDKDILIQGCMIYSPVTCTFVNREVNSVLSDARSIRGELPIGVTPNKKRYKGRCCLGGIANGKHADGQHLGTRDTPHEAHQLWQIAKRNRLLDLANLRENLHVHAGLMLRVSQLNFDIANNRETFKL